MFDLRSLEHSTIIYEPSEKQQDKNCKFTINAFDVTKSQEVDLDSRLTFLPSTTFRPPFDVPDTRVWISDAILPASAPTYCRIAS